MNKTNLEQAHIGKVVKTYHFLRGVLCVVILFFMSESSALRVLLVGDNLTGLIFESREIVSDLVRDLKANHNIEEIRNLESTRAWGNYLKRTNENYKQLLYVWIIEFVRDSIICIIGLYSIFWIALNTRKIRDLANCKIEKVTVRSGIVEQVVGGNPLTGARFVIKAGSDF